VDSILYKPIYKHKMASGVDKDWKQVEEEMACSVCSKPKNVLSLTSNRRKNTVIKAKYVNNL